MKLGKHGQFTFHVPTSGGKAGKGFQKTSSIQVMHGACIVKQFRFTIANQASRLSAIAKAKQFAKEHE